MSDWLDNEGPEFSLNALSDFITETADSAVPVYTSDIMDLAGDQRIYGLGNELGGETLEDIAKGNIYSAVDSFLHGELGDLEDELFDDCPECFDRDRISTLEKDPEGWCEECASGRDDDELDAKSLPLFGGAQL